MNNLINRDYHETIGKIIKFEVNEDLQRGNQYLDRIPYNYIGEMEEQLKRKPTEDTPLQMTDEQISGLYPRLCFNLPNNEFNMMESKFIDEKDHWNLMELLEKYPQYSGMSKMTLYSFCRNLCNNPITNEERKKINTDLKVIKKSMKHLNNKSVKKKQGNFKVDF